MHTLSLAILGVAQSATAPNIYFIDSLLPSGQEQNQRPHRHWSMVLPCPTPAKNLENCQDVWGSIAKNLAGTTEFRMTNQREDSAKRD